MTIINTTFQIECTEYQSLLLWLRETYLPAGLSAGLEAPRLARILGGKDPDGIGVACQLMCPSLSAAKKWERDGAAPLLAEARRRWDDKIVWFTTYMEVLL